jgi:hypothetical protein
MSIAKYVTQFLRESNKIVVQPVVVTTQTDPEDDVEYESNIDTANLDEADPHAGGTMAAADFKSQISDEVTTQNKRQTAINTQASAQQGGSKSHTSDIEKSGNISDYEGYKDNESTAQAQRQADLNKLSTFQHKGSKTFTSDLDSSNSEKAIKDGKDETKKLKGKRQGDLSTQKNTQLGSTEMSGQRDHHGVDKRESIDFIDKFTFTEGRPQAGSSKNPDVDPSIGGEVKSGIADSEKVMAQRLATQEKLKSKQVQGKKITADAQSTNSTGTFTKGGDEADKLTDARVKELEKFNSSQHAGEKSRDADLKTSDSFAAMVKAAGEADSLQSQRTSHLAALQGSQQAESYKDQESMDVFKGVSNPNVASSNPAQGKKIINKDKIDAKLEKHGDYDNDDNDINGIKNAKIRKKMKDEAVFDAGNVKGIEGIDSRDDVSLPGGKFKKGTTKTTTTKQAVANTPVPKEAVEPEGKDVEDDDKEFNFKKKMKGKGKEKEGDEKDESQNVTEFGKEAEAAAKANLKNGKKESAEDRAEALIDSITEKVVGLPSDDVLVAMKGLLTKAGDELDESVKKEMVLKGYINAFNEITESSKQILRTREARRRLAELSL